MACYFNSNKNKQLQGHNEYEERFYYINIVIRAAWGQLSD